MEIKYPQLIKVQHSKRGVRTQTIVMISIIIALSALLCMSARAEAPRVIYSPNERVTVMEREDGGFDKVIYDAKNGIAVREADNPYTFIPISDSEYEELRWILALEAQTEGLVGEIACCEAIFNRVLSQKNNWGQKNGLHGVLSMKKQFSTYKLIGSPKAYAVPGELEDDAISETIRRGRSILPSYSYVYFDSLGGVNGINKFRLGAHTFGEE